MKNKSYNNVLMNVEYEQLLVSKRHSPIIKKYIIIMIYCDVYNFKIVRIF